MTVRIFLAFDTEHDQDLCDQMVANCGGERAFEISGRSQNGSAPEAWQRGTQGRIAAADQVVVVCGTQTDQSEPVAAELSIAREQGKPVILLWSRRDGMCKKPAGARPDDSMLSWTTEILRRQILANRRQAALSVRVPDRLKRQTPQSPPADG